MRTATNHGYINSDSERRADQGILRPVGGAHKLPLDRRTLERGTSIYRIVSTLADKPIPEPEDYRTLIEFEEAQSAWLDKHHEDNIWGKLRGGCWWFTDRELTQFKHASMERGKPLTDIGRQSLAIAEVWSNGEFLLHATVTVDALQAYAGNGRRQEISEDFGSIRVVTVLNADPNAVQLYVPGLHILENATSWLRLEERIRLR